MISNTALIFALEATGIGLAITAILPFLSRNVAVGRSVERMRLLQIWNADARATGPPHEHERFYLEAKDGGVVI
jgi:fucose permease